MDTLITNMLDIIIVHARRRLSTKTAQKRKTVTIVNDQVDKVTFNETFPERVQIVFCYAHCRIVAQSRIKAPVCCE